ncbi:hypothetical protein [Amycolatopsis pithecellobii]|uniref:Uncharacterized protein n=1 Tax=Amycolatopsis pithecellobii TaxID=664692 RepID=A0A6N7YPG3_9PSEU|nr:hypothetical protein [Amycolatopsis pithecellobii]MTD54897.1 hypothetical protein [Amycolatopsis pithecellobii]
MNDSPHFQQNFGDGHQGNIFASQGGVQNVYLESMKNHFQNGLRALKGEMYAKAVTEFEESLADATKAGADETAEGRHDLASAHFHAALAMLNGRPPGDRVPEQIKRVESHLVQAAKFDDPIVPHQANVLWAVVQDDYYRANGMRVKEPIAGDFPESLYALSQSELQPLVEHLKSAQGAAWEALTRRAVEFGMKPAVSQEDTPVTRVHDPGRAEAVKKYFIPTPRLRTAAPAVTALVGCLAMLGFAAALHNIASVVFVAGIYFAGRWGWRQFTVYQRYRKRLAEAEPKPADEQMDAWLAEDVEILRSQAGDRVRLNPLNEDEGGDLVYPVQAVVGIPAEGATGAKGLRIRRGHDRRWRANHYDVLILFLTNDLISLYRCTLDFHTGEPVYEELTERHYRDIVGVSSNRVPVPQVITDLFKALDSLTAEAGAQPDEQKYADLSFAQTFTMSIVSGERIELNTGFGDTIGSDNQIAWASNSRALNIIKKMVRARHTSN